MPNVRRCQLCKNLVRNRDCICNGLGQYGARILLVGQAPGKVENQKKKPFQGKAGRALAALTKMAGISKDDVYLINAVRCWPPGDRKPKKEEWQACRSNLMKEIAEVRPKIIVALGEVALHSLLNDSRPTISSVLGHRLVQPDTSLPMVPTFHPSFVQRNWEWTPVVVSHLQKALRIADDQDFPEELGSYATVQSLDDLKALRDYLLSPEVKRIAFDTETTGLSWMTDELLCISFSPEEGIGYVVPILVKEGNEVLVPFWAASDWPRVIELLREILGSDKPKVAQNAGFDISMLERSTDMPVVTAATAFGILVKNLQYDTMFLSKALAERLPANLAALGSHWRNVPYYEAEVSEQSKKKRHMELVKNEDLWQYAGADADTTGRITTELEPRVEASGSMWLHRNVTIPLIDACWKMEQRGMLVDRDLFDKLCGLYRKRIAAKEEELHKLAGYKCKYGSAEPIKELLFKRLKLPKPSGKTDSGLDCSDCTDKPCDKHAQTGKTALQEVYEKCEHPILPVLMELKKLTKFSSTNLDGGTGGYARYIQSDNRIHAHIKVGFADTGRHSCENPNLQNTPKKVEEATLGLKDALRQIFIPPPGCVMMNADWSQVEVWVLAYETGDETLMSLLLGGEDVHTYVARKLCEMGISSQFPQSALDPKLDNYEWKQLHPELRRRAKVFVFGTSYGLTAHGAAVRLGCSVEEGDVLIDAYMQIIPTLPDYFARVENEILTNYALSNHFGRWRHFPDVPILQTLSYSRDLDALIRVGINFPIQSGAHDLHGIAHVDTENSPIIKRAAPVMENHDALLFEAKAPNEKYIHQTARMIKFRWENLAKNLVMPDGTKLGWRCPVEVEWGPSAGEYRQKLTTAGDIIDVEE